MHPTNWPRCRCGAFTLDGKATCGDYRCGVAARDALRLEIDMRTVDVIDYDDPELDALVRQVEER